MKSPTISTVVRQLGDFPLLISAVIGITLCLISYQHILKSSFRPVMTISSALLCPIKSNYTHFDNLISTRPFWYKQKAIQSFIFTILEIYIPIAILIFRIFSMYEQYIKIKLLWGFCGFHIIKSSVLMPRGPELFSHVHQNTVCPLQWTLPLLSLAASVRRFTGRNNTLWYQTLKIWAQS